MYCVHLAQDNDKLRALFTTSRKPETINVEEFIE
jgi:hypothetical protein